MKKQRKQSKNYYLIRRFFSLLFAAVILTAIPVNYSFALEEDDPEITTAAETEQTNATEATEPTGYTEPTEPTEPTGSLDPTGDGGEIEEPTETESEIENEEEEAAPPMETETPKPGSISGFVWVDEGNNFDGVNSEDKLPIADYTVYLYAADDLASAIDETLSGEDGTYQFAELEPGNYVLAIASETVNYEEYLLPYEITEENKFAVDWESEPLMAYTDIIELQEDQSVEDINAGLLKPMAMPMMMGMMGSKPVIDIDLHLLTANTSGPGWTYNHATTKITFDSTASGNEYRIKRTVHGYSRKDIVVDAAVNDITIRYDGPNIFVNGYPNNTTPTYYYEFNSDITINGGDRNTVIYDKVYNITKSVLTINSAAQYTIVEYSGVSTSTSTADATQRVYTLNNNGSDTTVIYDGVTIRSAVFNHNGNNKATMYLRGTNLFFYSFETKLADLESTSLDLFLSGSTTSEYKYVSSTLTNPGGYIAVPQKASLTIDSEAATGSESGSLSLSRNQSAWAVIGGTTHSGNITIKGGTLKVINLDKSAKPTGAAIGGGNNGDGTVIITGGNITAEAYDGACIGGGNNGTGYVTITGGTITATNAWSGSGGGGAGIGGGKYGPGIVHIISDNSYTPNITSYAAQGAGIGNGAGGTKASGFGYGKSHGEIKITGGKIYAYSVGGAGVGVGYESSNPAAPPEPTFEICHIADIATFGNGLYNINAGFMGNGNNKGDAYFVNLYYYGGIFGVTDRVIVVYADGDKTTPLRIDPIPWAFTGYAYTTGTTSSRDDNVYMTYDTTGEMRQLVRYVTKNPIIYSVNGKGQYFTQHNAAVDWQTVVFTEGVGAAQRRVDEHYIDTEGNKVAGIIPNPKTVMITSGGTYTKSGVPSVPGYTYKGYKWNNKPSGSNDFLTGLPPAEANITTNRNIYFVYSLTVETDVTISKTVTGSFADRNRAFTFTALFTDSGGTPMAGKQFDYTGSITLSTGSKMILDGSGCAVFTLKHGQSITIKDVPSDAKIQITETTDENYNASFKDSLEQNPINRLYTDLTDVGDEHRIFAFVNTRKAVVPTGVDDDLLYTEILMLIIMAVVLSGFAASEFIRKKYTKQN